MSPDMQRPNILIIHTDQQRWDTLKANGNQDIHTPNLDRLAAEGVNFDHHFVQNPVCMPSRVSFLTGQYPSALRITHMGVPVPSSTMTLAHLLRPYGYRSAYFGKMHFLPHANRDHRVPHPAYGFDQLEICDEPGIYEDSYRAWVRSLAPDQLEHLSIGLPPSTDTWYRTMGWAGAVPHQVVRPRDGMGVIHPFPGDEQYTHSAWVADRTIDFLHQQPDRRPFLCMAGFYPPHTPWVVPQRYLDLYDPTSFRLPAFPPELEAGRVAAGCTDERLRLDRHGYYALISEVDHHVGRILEALSGAGLAGQTLVIFTSDHGFWMGEHLKWSKGYPGDDAIARVPLLVRWPGALASPGRTVHGLIEAVDVLPTLLEAAGIPIPPHVQGRSFLSALVGAQGDSGPRPTEGVPFAGREAVLMESAGWKNLRSATFRYLVRSDGRESLWDLAADPGENHDVAADPAYSAILTEGRHLLLKRLLQIEQPLERTWPY